MSDTSEITSGIVESAEVRINRENGKLDKDFLPFNTYEFSCYGYPVANKYHMLTRYHGGFSKDGLLLPSKGKYCLVEDAMKVINQLKK